MNDNELFDCGCGEDEGCGCGCGCEHEHEEEIMTITLEDGTEMECAIIAIFPVGEKDYIALLPLENQEDGEVFLYGFEEHEDGSFELLSIESDEEYEKVTTAFDEILDEAEIDELLDDEDEE
ncbi:MULTISPECIES: DUF1292 domain-containing protein [unclassified Sedimentibacter]|uniref:DUF1292 domain-containing protein n=1 Tax=unclassified Sedimentibacter TaxID=2649220 RepID=UPI0027E0F891|nr:DUF1292 domain-containing protein [Sedimentibacter sp. MB35-C1]WMJ75714.1 DUF1292 domain-containing protein [Sedimentibacter sp. MB35-C1]